MKPFKSFILALFLLGIYSEYHFHARGIFIPFILCLPAGILLFIANLNTIKKSTINYFVLFTYLNIGISLFSYIIVGYDIVEVSKSLLVFEYSMFLALLFFDEICEWPNRKLADFLNVAIYILLLLCLLDLFFMPFHELNLQLLKLSEGHSIGPSSRIATLFGGFRRPFPLTKEPSHVAKFVLIILPAWFVLDSRRQYIKYFILGALFLAIVRSPIILGVFGLGVLFLLTDKSFKQKILPYLTIRIITVFLICLFGFFAFKIMSHRLPLILEGGDASTMVRIVRPFYVLKTSLINYPFFGVGVGNTELLANLYFHNYGSFLLSQELGGGYTIFSLFAPIAFVGIIGYGLHFTILVKYMRETRKFNNIFILLIHYILISIAMAAFLTVTYWTYIFIIVKIYTGAQQKSSIYKNGLNRFWSNVSYS